MGVLDRLLGRRMDRRRGVLAVETVTEIEEEPRIPKPPETAGTAQLERPAETPSMRLPRFGRTAGTPGYRQPSGTPSTERIHNPARPGR